MKKIFYYLSLILILISCNKEEDYSISINDLNGLWTLDRYDSYNVDTDDEIIRGRTQRLIELYKCEREQYLFKIDDTREKPFWMDRNSCSRGILGCYFRIDEDKLIDAANQIEAFDLRINCDTLFMSIDETVSFNSELNTNQLKKVIIRNRYIRQY